MTYAAVAVELHVDDATAAVELDRIVVAADAGEVIDPKGLANQLEGGAVQSASWTLKEQVSFDDTRVTSTDWETYPIIAFPDVPRVDVELIDRPDLPPLGAGRRRKARLPPRSRTRFTRRSASACATCRLRRSGSAPRSRRSDAIPHVCVSTGSVSRRFSSAASEGSLSTADNVTRRSAR